jgi:RNA polymerase sigma-70 factor (ECF subfamily)
LNRLKSLDRETLVSFYIQGQSLLEMSEDLDTPVGTIKRRLHTARKRLRAELQADQADADEWVDGADHPFDDEEDRIELAICS